MTKRKIKSEKLLGQFQLGQREHSLMVLKRIEYEDGSIVFDCREFINSDTYSGPTRRGLRLNIEDWKRVRKLIKELNAYM